MMLLSDYANPYECLKSFSKHLQPLCCLSHPRFLNSLMHLQIPSYRSEVPLCQINHTNQCVEVLYCVGIYVGAIIMTLGV